MKGLYRKGLGLGSNHIFGFWQAYPIAGLLNGDVPLGTTLSIERVKRFIVQYRVVPNGTSPVFVDKDWRNYL